MKFEIEKQSGVPLYQQLASQIQGAIDTGNYREGDKLPTEAELFDSTGVSKGTIKAAYEQLQQMGYIRKIQGSGAYVQRPAGAQLKAKAAQLAERLFDEIALLPNIGVSQAYTLFRQELAHAFAKTQDVCAALVICAPELLELTARRLNRIEHLTVRPYLLDDVLAGRVFVSAECDFLLTTQSNSVDLIQYTSAMRLKMEKMSLEEGSSIVTRLTKIPPGQTVGVVYRSQSFYGNIQDSFRTLGLQNPVLACQEQDAAECFEAAPEPLALLVPPDYEKNCGAQIQQLVACTLERGGEVIPFQYLIDQGSLMHLEHKVQELYAAKNSGETLEGR